MRINELRIQREKLGNDRRLAGSVWESARLLILELWAEDIEIIYKYKTYIFLYKNKILKQQLMNE